ncbi:MAG: hypothetical protein AAFV95_00220 [Bacteroidota bacterium]
MRGKKSVVYFLPWIEMSSQKGAHFRLMGNLCENPMAKALKYCPGGFSWMEGEKAHCRGYRRGIAGMNSSQKTNNLLVANRLFVLLLYKSLPLERVVAEEFLMSLFFEIESFSTCQEALAGMPNRMFLSEEQPGH